MIITKIIIIIALAVFIIDLKTTIKKIKKIINKRIKRDEVTGRLTKVDNERGFTFTKEQCIKHSLLGEDTIQIPRVNNTDVFFINFNIDNNILIEGNAGSGKTYLLKSIVEQTLKNNDENKVYVISGGGRNEFNYLNITEFASEKEECLKLLITLNKEINRRINNIENSKFGRIVVIIDGIKIISTKSPDEDKEVLEKIEKELVLLGKVRRSAKINIVITKYKEEHLSKKIKNNISTKIEADTRIGYKRELIKIDNIGTND